MSLLSSDNPERNAIVSDLISKLSDEAKFVLGSIIAAPDELAQLMFYGIINKSLVYQKIKEYGLEKKQYYLMHNEIQNVVGSGDISRKTIKKYLKRNGWNTMKINKAMGGLKRLLSDIATI